MMYISPDLMHCFDKTAPEEFASFAKTFDRGACEMLAEGEVELC